MIKTKKIFIFLAIFLMLIMPVFSLAQTSTELIPCGKTLQADKTIGATTYKKGEVIPCNFTDFMKLIDNVIKFILYKLAIPIAAIMFAYAGFKMVTSGGSTESRTQAKSIFTNTALGLIFVAGAYLLVKTILSILGYDGAWLGF